VIPSRGIQAVGILVEIIKNRLLVSGLPFYIKDELKELELKYGPD
jgi:hypothetical protein